MAHLKLNTTTSIVDFLKSQGRPSSFQARERLFRESGLEDRLGTFVGSGAQNLALLRKLRGEQQAAPITPAPAPRIRPFGTPGPFTPAPATPPTFRAPDATRPARPPIAGREPTLDRIEPTPTAALAPPKEPTPKPKPTPPPSALDVLSKLGIEPPPTDEELIERVKDSPQFKLFEEKVGLFGRTKTAQAEAAKQVLEREFISDLDRLQNTLAPQGLTFSGIAATQVRGLAESLASSKLKIDRELAVDLLEKNIEVRERILDDVADLIKDAKDDRKEAQEVLEQFGFTIVGNQVIPSPDIETFVTAVGNGDLSIDKVPSDKRGLVIQRVREKFGTIPMTKEELADLEQRAEDVDTFAKAVRAGQKTLTSVPNKIEADVIRRINELGGFPPGALLTKAEKNALSYDKIRLEAGSKMLSSENLDEDGFTDPTIFAEFREKVKEEVPTFIDDFDKLYGSLLNPNDAAAFGLEGGDPIEASLRRVNREISQ